MDVQNRPIPDSVFCTDLDQQSLPSEPEEALSRELGEGEETELAPPEDLLGSPQAISRQDLDSEEEEEDVAAKETLLRLSSPLHFVNTHFNGAGSPTDGVKLSPGGPVETLSPEAAGGDLTPPPSTLSPLLRLAESDPVPSPSVLPPLPQDSPQPLPAPEEEEALTTEDFELLDRSPLPPPRAVTQVAEPCAALRGEGGGTAPHRDTFALQVFPQTVGKPHAEVAMLLQGVSSSSQQPRRVDSDGRVKMPLASHRLKKERLPLPGDRSTLRLLMSFSCF